MPLKCQICGKEYLYDGKICHTCEESAIISGLTSQNRKERKWRCDNFIELNGLVFGSNLNKRREVGLKPIECPECGEMYSYGRKIWHTCEGNSLPFGRLFESDHKPRRWNCDTAMACIELLTSDLDTVEFIVKDKSHIEKLEKTEYEWNQFTTIKYNNEQIDGKNKLLIYE
ncbi:MAG: hypothetical protein ACFFG0_46875 [Candidatus Thorarchaeota archaeon]